MWASTSTTLGAWTRGVVRNGVGTTAAATLAFTVAGCARGPGVAGASGCAGTLAGDRSVVNGGTVPAARLAASVRGESCGPVQAVNRAKPANPMLPRYGTTFRQPDPFGTSTAMTLDGTAYAAAVQSQVSTSTSGSTYGYGIWFRAAAGQGGTLFGFDASPTDTATAGLDDRQLTLNATTGRLTFASLQGLGLLQPGPATSTGSFNDGRWHFAYVTMSSGSGTLVNTLYVDGTQQARVASVSLGLLQYISTTGYWHVGWGPASTPAHFTGSLSNFVVFAAGNAPAAPAANPATQAAFDTFAAGASEHWRLDDTGTTTYTGSHPVIGATSPCTLAALTWTFGGTTVLNAVPASTFAAGTSYAVPAVPGPGASQASRLTVARTSGASAYVAGLRLLVPATYAVRTVPGTWSLGFRFAGAESALVVP